MTDMTQSSGARLHHAVRILAGLIVASGFAAAVFSVSASDVRVYPFALIVIGIFGTALGLPIYVAARSAGKDTPKFAGVSGFFVGAVIPALAILSNALDQASIAGTATVIDGSYTLAGWVNNLATIGLYGLLGVSGALVFWYIVRTRPPEDGAERSSLLPRTLVSLIAASVVVGGAFLIPQATADRSCHNPLRDGATSIAQAASFDLNVGFDEWRNVEAEVERFRGFGDWSVRSDIRTEKDFPWFQVSLCKEPGTNIFVQGMEEFGSVSFGVYQPQGGDTWRSDFRALHDRVKARWPDKVTYKDDQGRETSAPTWATSRAGSLAPA